MSSNKLLDLITYIFINYPDPEELSIPRLVKLIFLIDWKASIENKKQVTKIKWHFGSYGPYVDDVIKLIKENEDTFSVESYLNPFGGGLSDKIHLKKEVEVKLDDKTKSIADFVIKNTFNLNWSDFISVILTTYPVRTNSKYSKLNLVKDALQYKKEKRLKAELAE